jgi:hypothetical protein
MTEHISKKLRITEDTQIRPYILFFSPKCVHSTKLMNIIQQDRELTKSSTLIDVHTIKVFPPGMNCVPTILYNDNLIVGSEAFEWIKSLISPT